ncbi:hypothetical protein EDD36DRAFT_180104 [Exophiala viscosa]|uniref:Transcription factor domain-containing protein n=1 Tax=Exophiala viscosa TaxID=2486360 RepID=A0AAN6IER2_9EURO|nr:hypothetical protein EDD36DRAFT_180104 [Exophiala viscosa]
MTAIQSASMSSPFGANPCPHSTQKRKGYKKIRWTGAYDPKAKSSRGNDPFVQWRPPGSKESEVNEPKTITLRQEPKQSDEANPSLRVIAASPLQPLPSNGTRVDPFLCLPVKATDSVRNSMDYFVMICKGMSKETTILAGPNAHLSLLLPFALEHAILFESMMAVCRASVLLSLGRPAFEDSAFIQHRGNAIAGLNKALRSTKCGDDASLLTVTMLMTLEYLVGDHRSVHMHCQGLEKMLQLRKQFPEEEEDTDWSKFVKLGLMAYKALGSFVTGQPPDIPSDSPGFLKETFEDLALDKPLSYPEPPFSTDLCIILSRLPSGFSELCLKSRISVQMINLLASVSGAATLLTTKTLLDGVYLSPPAEDSPYGEENRQVMIQTLLSSLQRMSLTTTVPVEHNLTSGLLAYAFQLRSLSQLTLFYDPLLQNFVTTLPYHLKPSTPEEQHGLIWASIAAAGALALRAVPFPGAHTVMDHALELYPQARTWSRLEVILRRFFWTNEILAHWKTVWEMAMKRRQHLLRREKGNIQALAPMQSEWSDLDHEAISNHIKGAPRAMREMSQAMGICPFRPRPSSELTVDG